jgi:hypothetical protein
MPKWILLFVFRINKEIVGESYSTRFGFVLRLLFIKEQLFKSGLVNVTIKYLQTANGFSSRSKYLIKKSTRKTVYQAWSSFSEYLDLWQVVSSFMGIFNTILQGLNIQKNWKDNFIDEQTNFFTILIEIPTSMTNLLKYIFYFVFI